MTKRMTIAQFLAALRKTPRKWELLGDGGLRCKDGRCPIVAVATQVRPRPRKQCYNSDVWHGAGPAIGLSHTSITNIVVAADRRCHSTLRAKILAACGLKEAK